MEFENHSISRDQLLVGKFHVVENRYEPPVCEFLEGLENPHHLRGSVQRNRGIWEGLCKRNAVFWRGWKKTTAFGRVHEKKPRHFGGAGKKTTAFGRVGEKKRSILEGLERKPQHLGGSAKKTAVFWRGWKENHRQHLGGLLKSPRHFGGGWKKNHSLRGRACEKVQGILEGVGKRTTVSEGGPVTKSNAFWRGLEKEPQQREGL